MQTSEYQKQVIVLKAKADKNHKYTVINMQAIDKAAAQLKANTFKLWLYIAKNQNKYKFALSRIAFCRWAGVAKNTYITAVKTLQQFGYLVPKKQNSNTYYFYEDPSNIVTPTSEDINVEVTQTKKEEIQTFNL